MIALVSIGQVQPGQLDEVVRRVAEMTLLNGVPGFRRYDFLVDRAQNKTLAMTVFETRADLDAFRASPALRDAYAGVMPPYTSLARPSGESGKSWCRNNRPVLSEDPPAAQSALPLVVAPSGVF